MLDPILRRRSETALTPAARRLAGWGIGARMLTLAAFAAGAAGLVVIGHRHYLPGLALLALAGALDALDGPVARLGGGSAPLEQVLSLVLAAAVPFAFALAEPDRALAAMFLMLGLVARAGAATIQPSALGSLIGKTELFIAFALACVFPQWFSLIAYAVGILCFVAAGSRLATVLASSRP